MDYAAFKDKARQNLTVAEWCYEHGHYDACCNRAYYAMYHAAIAILAQERITPSQSQIDHGWVQSQFVTYFCNRHKIYPKLKSYLLQAQENRNLADYKSAQVNQKRTNRQLQRSREFVETLLRRLEYT